MASFGSRICQRLRVAGLLALVLFASRTSLAAQVPGQLPSGQQLPSSDSARALLRNPAVVEQLRQQIQSSGLTPDQVHARLRAAGYPENLLDDYMSGADTTRQIRPGPRTFEAVRALGLLSEQESDSLRLRDSLRVETDSLRQLLDSLRDRRADSLRADSLADSLRLFGPSRLKLFGLETFRRTSTRFQPAQAGPVGENYRLGSGDVLVLILTGDVEQSYTLEVTREGFVVIPQVGQVYVANLTMAELRDQLYSRLGRIYSGVRRSARATTQFQISLARLRNIQVFVAGDVVRPGAYLISAAGTVLSALYAAGGPTENGSFRLVEIRRGGKLVDTLDVYDYLLRGNNRSDIRLSTGDVVFVPVHSGFVKVAGKVTRPAIYELRPNETLGDVIQFAGGFDPTATRARVQVHRILPAGQRTNDGGARVVIDVGPDQFAGGSVPALPMAPGDSVTVFSLAPRVRSYVTVRGNVWVEGTVGFTPGMHLSDAIRLAGGTRPDVYLDRILVSRLAEDSSMVQLRSAFADSTGKVKDDLLLQDQDEIRVFSRTSFRPELYISVVGAVGKPGRVLYREGMTVRDAVLLAGGLTEDAYLKEAEIARLANRTDPNALATTIKAPLDSTYLFGRGTDGAYMGPPGAPAPASGAPEVQLAPYDNVLILRQPGWDLQRLVYLQGQVKYPGRYALTSKTERLEDLIRRAGGLTDQAYPGGIEFYRLRPWNPPIDRDSTGKGRPRDEDTDKTRPRIRDRVGVDLPRVLRDAKYRDNLMLAGGDSIFIPEFNPVVTVDGAVNAPGAVAYIPGGTIDVYIRGAGGISRLGDKNRAYVTQPDGKVEPARRRFLLPDRNPHPRPGARVFVPNRDTTTPTSNTVAILGTVASIVASLVTIVVVAKR
jgi:polysaccharide export outer membrane protein